MPLKRVFLGLMVVCACHVTLAQTQHDLDSLIENVVSIPEDKTGDHFYFIRQGLEKLPHAEKFKAIQKLVVVSERPSLSDHDRASLYVSIAAVYSWSDSAQLAFRWFQKSINYAKSLADTAALAQAHHELGQFQVANYLYVEALKNALIAKDLAGLRGDTVHYYVYITEVMKIYSQSGDHLNAIKTSAEVLKLYRNSTVLAIGENKTWQVMHLYNNIGLTYKNLKQYDSALHYYSLVKKLAYELNNEFWQALSDGNSAVIYIEQKQYDLAIPLLINDLRISIKYNQMSSAANTALVLGDYFVSAKQYKKGKAYLDSAAILIEKYQLPTPPSFWNAKAEYEFSQGDYKTAWETKNKFVTERIAAINRRESANILRIQSSYDLERKQNQINDLTEDADTNEQQLILQRYITGAALISLLLLLGLVVNVIINYRRQKKINAVIKDHQKETREAHYELNIAYNNLKIAQDHLIQTEKMAFLGQLTAGIAHEINTPLGAIKASAENVQSSLRNIRESILNVAAAIPAENAQLVLELISQPPVVDNEFSFAKQREQRKACITELKKLGLQNADILGEYVLNAGVPKNYEKWRPLLMLPQTYELFRLINELILLNSQNGNIALAVSKASKILFALKTYSHPGTHENTVKVNLVQNMEVVLSIYAANLQQIKLVCNFEEVPSIQGYPEELNQVWINIIYNAIQAMGGVGSLVINIQRHSTTELKVEIIDTGSGISPENQKRLFEPFFTTKSAGEGTGLGLSIVKKIIDKHSARIECESVPMKGTTFRFLFPIPKD